MFDLGYGGKSINGEGSWRRIFVWFKGDGVEGGDGEILVGSLYGRVEGEIRVEEGKGNFLVRFFIFCFECFLWFRESLFGLGVGLKKLVGGGRGLEDTYCVIYWR